uniref:Embryo surrounding factor 1 brassicaceae domain-containing protein n=1 Tax=Brassica campestris TaxID=3711 RepID=A0A3P5YLA5_BRACM|nr:unnamed protein product [Brassica rapa]
MSPTNLALFFVYLVIIGTATDVSPVTKQFQFLTVRGCNNDCETSCCDCNIEKQPPVCVQCCLI